MASGPVVASLTANVRFGAGGGWAVWSGPTAGGWGLEGSHACVVRALGVAPRPEPFDLNVASPARGGPVVAFSRCAKTPQGVPFGLGFLAH